MSILVLAVAAGVWIGLGTQDSTQPDTTQAEATLPQPVADERWMDDTITRDKERKADEPPTLAVPDEEPDEELQDELSGDEPSEPEPAPGCGDYGGNQRIACDLLPEHGFATSEMSCLSTLWDHESGWNEHAENPGSGAYGIPQALPGNKMASAGDDWQTNPATQIRWGLGYIGDRYGTPCGAWQHFQSNGWY